MVSLTMELTQLCLITYLLSKQSHCDHQYVNHILSLFDQTVMEFMLVWFQDAKGPIRVPLNNDTASTRPCQQAGSFKIMIIFRLKNDMGNPYRVTLL